MYFWIASWAGNDIKQKHRPTLWDITQCKPL